MLFSKLFAISALAASALAQGRIYFTSQPGSVQAGKPVTISWDGGDGSPVTITLKKGDPNNLQTVAVITGNGSGKSFTWTPTSSLTNGNDYALSITQGEGTSANQTNYTGLFAISGGSDASATVSGTGTLVSVGSTATSALTTITGKTSGIILTTAAAGTGTGSLGTGTALARNTTFSSPTLASSTATITSGASTGAGGSSTRAAGPSSTGGAPAGLQAQGIVGAGVLAAAALFAL